MLIFGQKVVEINSMQNVVNLLVLKENQCQIVNHGDLTASYSIGDIIVADSPSEEPRNVLCQRKEISAPVVGSENPHPLTPSEYTSSTRGTVQTNKNYIRLHHGKAFDVTSENAAMVGNRIIAPFMTEKSFELVGNHDWRPVLSSRVDCHELILNQIWYYITSKRLDQNRRIN